MVEGRNIIVVWSSWRESCFKFLVFDFVRTTQSQDAKAETWMNRASFSNDQRNRQLSDDPRNDTIVSNDVSGLSLVRNKRDMIHRRSRRWKWLQPHQKLLWRIIVDCPIRLFSNSVKTDVGMWTVLPNLISIIIVVVKSALFFPSSTSSSSSRESLS
jgi:hypothetical protein